MWAFLIGSTVWAVAGLISWPMIQRSLFRPIHQRLDSLHMLVTAWQAAHDHQVQVLDRRMRAVEEAAARAENEVRMVANLVSGSGQ
jgi:hypothetical protein